MEQASLILFGQRPYSEIPLLQEQSKNILGMQTEHFTVPRKKDGTEQRSSATFFWPEPIKATWGSWEQCLEASRLPTTKYSAQAKRERRSSFPVPRQG